MCSSDTRHTDRQTPRRRRGQAHRHPTPSISHTTLSVHPSVIYSPCPACCSNFARRRITHEAEEAVFLNKRIYWTHDRSSARHRLLADVSPVGLVVFNAVQHMQLAMSTASDAGPCILFTVHILERLNRIQDRYRYYIQTSIQETRCKINERDVTDVTLLHSTSTRPMCICVGLSTPVTPNILKIWSHARRL